VYLDRPAAQIDPSCHGHLLGDLDERAPAERHVEAAALEVNIVP
jgi:hypothetical protein